MIYIYIFKKIITVIGAGPTGVEFAGKLIFFSPLMMLNLRSL